MSSFIDAGATVDFQLSDKLAASVDASYSTDVTNDIPIANVGVRLSYQLSPTWSIYGSWSAADRMKPGVMFGITTSL